MEYTVTEMNGKRFVEILSGNPPIETEQQGMDLISLCFEQQVNDILIPNECISDAFITLSTRLAGTILQKTVNYHIRVAAVIDEARFNPRFAEFAMESNKANEFRVFQSRDQAAEWLAG
ncbi:DUF4180 domain-containing protein [Eubacteriales bacterium OttesenSCG-928-N13]|nr:DUF4180 domain-containing protein [Eubacteriales bacterium OttesenSCG-928-N13]